MKKLLIIVLAMFIVSCSVKKNFIYYSFKDVTVTRFNKEPNEIYFYYGKYKNDDKLPNSYIKASYSGFDGGMEGFLIFKENKTIEIIRVYDSFSKVGDDKHLMLNETIENVDFIDWKDKINGNYHNVIELSNILKTEKIINKKNNSKVKAIYPN
ncbi:hypothetical protein NTJ28_002506 [Flavobacterium psychrophilum]|nr:hypothetical protein [Flavobacterium psychrophilum]EKT4510796.1 hypothetical protein [Flavobacterium psychrophilum]